MSDAASGDSTPGKAPTLKEPWKPGQSGNPKGRAKGSRNKLGEAFLSALHDDFVEHGAQSIVDVREKAPDKYLRVIAATLPQQLNVKIDEMDELTDEQLDRRIAALLGEYQRGIDAAARASEQASAAGTAEVLPTLQ